MYQNRPISCRVADRFDCRRHFEYWRLLDSNETAYIRMNKVSAFTEAALASNEVLLEAVDPFDDETIRFRVSLNGLREALGKLTCAP